jgi:hypothetical protein
MRRGSTGVSFNGSGAGFQPLAELLVAESSPEVPTGHGSERPPSLTKALDTTGSSVDLCDSSLESDVPYGKHIGLPKDHDAKDRYCPGANALDTGEGLFPCSSLLHLGENLVRSLDDVDAALGSTFRKTHCA